MTIITGFAAWKNILIGIAMPLMLVWNLFLNLKNKIYYECKKERLNGQPHGRSYRHWRIEEKVFKKREKFIEALKDFNP